MSETILNWLRTQPEFSNNINNIEEEFSNGYNFGKLLHANKLFDDMDNLKDSNKKEDSLKNFSILRKTFDLIDIHLTQSDINELINKKKYKAELYLFKIKQKLSLKKCQFDEIMEKMKEESITNKKINVDFILKTKRNQSAKPFANSKNNNNNYYNNTYNNQFSEKRNFSSSKNQNKFNLANYTSRLKSAKLPNLHKNNKAIDKKRQLFNDMNKDNEQELQDEKQIQSALNDIKIFENIHMNKNKKKFVGPNIKNPWDKIGYIYTNEHKVSLFNIENKNEENKKIAIFDLINNRKKINNTENNKENKIEKLKSTLHNHNQFNVDNKKNFINKKNFEQGLSKMGINANNMLPSIVKIKDKNIPPEIVMKSINETLKEKNIKKKNLLNNLNSPKNRVVYAPSPSPGKKLNYQKIESNDFNKEDDIKKRPFSSVTTYNKKYKKNQNKINKEENKKDFPNKKRPFTAKESKNIIKSKEINKLNENSKVNNADVKKVNRNYKKYLTKIEEDDLNFEEDLSQLSNSDEIDNTKKFNEKIFFRNLNKEKKDDKKLEKKKEDNLNNKKYMKDIVSIIIDMTEVYYDYQQTKGEELIDKEKWHEVEYKFIHNKPIIKRKKKKKVLTEEEIGNSGFDMYEKIDEEFSKKYGKYEISEMKNYVNKIGNKYDCNKNNLFIKKMNIKGENIEINDVMGDEIQILFDKAKVEGRDIKDEDDEEEFKRTGKYRYHPTKEEEEFLQPYTKNINEYIFTNLISDIIKFGYNKDPNKEYPSTDKNQKGISGVIEEPKIEDSNNNNEDENLNLNEEKNENINEKENIVSLKDIINSIPIKLSFVGILNNEIKITIKNSLSKYPKMKIYNPIDFLNDLREKKKKIDEPIDEQNLRKFQIDQLKKEKNNLTAEIKDYIELLENKDNLSDDEMCIKLLQKKIREDFEIKKMENIKQEIISKRENITNINNELNKIKEEQQKKQKVNLRELQVYQQQLDKIEQESMIGFVIINFPNNYEQSKLLEEKMIDFVEPCEQNISYFDKINQKLLFLCDKEQRDNIFFKFNSFLEKMVYFYCDNSKLIHEDENNAVRPPNIGNNQNIQIEKFTTTQIKEYKNNFKKLEEFYQNFNLQIDKYDYYEGIIEESNNPNNFNNNINMNSNNFMIRDKVIIEKMRNAINIYEEKIVPKIENINLMDESNEEGLDQIKEKDSSRKVSGDSSLKQAVNNTSKTQINKQRKDSNNSSSFKNNELIKPQVSSNIKKESKKQMVDNKLKILPIDPISDEEKMKIYKLWYNFNIQYDYYICRLFYRERNIKRKNPDKELEDLQNKFINFLSNSKDQKIIIGQFIQKYKTFKDTYCKSNKINDSSNITIINNFQKDLVELNETLWDIAKIRKNQAFEEIGKLEKDNHINKELNLCYFKMERLIILETQKLIVTINILIRYFTLILNPKFLITNPQIVQFDIILSKEILKDVNKEEFAIQKDKKIIYPRANRLYKNCFKVLIKIYIFLENFYAFISSKDKKNINYSVYKSMKLKKSKKPASTHNSAIVSTNNINIKFDLHIQIKDIIRMHINKYKFNMYNLYLNTLENLSKIYCPFKQVIKLMDNWIILSMELQNKKIKETLKILDLTNNYKNNINNDKKLNEQIEKNIVEQIIKDDNNIFNFEYEGISNDDFALLDIKKFVGVSNVDERKDKKDKDCLKIYELFKEGDILTKLRNNEIQKGIITKSKFEEIFFKYFLFEKIGEFPDAFKSIDYHNISNFLSYFTVLSSDFRKNKIENNENEAQELIFTNNIITILLLCCISFDIYKENENYSENYINKDKFMEINFEFENEINKISDKGKEFKSFLFLINENNSDPPEINIKQFYDILSLKIFKNLPKTKITKYFDLFEY